MEYQGARSACGGQTSDRGDECVRVCACECETETEKEDSLISCELSQSFLLLLQLAARASPSLPSSITVSSSIFLLWEAEEL